ncbi:MAG TPA: hypothetical protein PKI01_02975 [Bacteroidales bacterium]|nr:hypothetical protein [Bacteroidales bacterium]
MKKKLSLLVISILVVFAACGPGQKNSAAEEKAKQDSLANASREPQNFETFFKTFVVSLKGANSLDNYIHKDIGVYVYTNPGAFCSASKSMKVADMADVKNIPATNIFNRTPKGDFCEGYPGEKDGFYYSETSKEALPDYYDVAAETAKKIILPAKLNYKKFMKVNVIMGEYFKVDLYFTCIDSSWYLIGQRFCDCSA